MTETPIPLREDPDAPAALRDDLRRSQQAEGPPYDLDGGLARLEATLGTAGPMSPRAPSAGAPSGSSSDAAVRWLAGRGWQLLAGAAVVGAAIALVVTPRPLPPSGVAAERKGDGPALPPPAAGVVPVEKDAASRDPAAVSDPPLGPASPRGAEPSAVPPAKGARRRITPHVTEDGEAPAAARREIPARAAALPSEAAAPEVARAVDVPSPPPPVGEDLTRREVAHLAEVRRALATDPAQALRMAEEGHARFPAGFMREEREASAVIALFRLRRALEASRRADAFLARYPGGPFSDRIRALAGARL